MEKSVYDQIGGFAALRKLIVEFYNRVLDDDELAPIFVNSNMERVIDHQTKFFAMLFGGPASYTDDELKKIHDNIKIKNEHFDLTKEHFIETLEDFDLNADHIDHVSNEFEIRRKLIVSE